jgi:hypothetical protein
VDGSGRVLSGVHVKLLAEKSAEGEELATAWMPDCAVDSDAAADA